MRRHQHLLRVNAALAGAAQSTAALSVCELMQLDRAVRRARLAGASQTAIASLNRAISDRLRSLPLSVGLAFQNTLPAYPLGASFETRRGAPDNAHSSARQTFRILNAAHQALSLAQLEALDTDGDGSLTAQEMTNLWAWSDTNEDGRLSIGNAAQAELQPLFSALRQNGESRLSARFYGLHTAGNVALGQLFLGGDAGDDYLDGGTGADRMRGGAGNDVYIVNSAHDQILELANQGHDRVYSAVSYALESEVEDLTLLSGAAINATGNRHDNTLIGNAGDNILDGVTGADTMVGGRGNDCYYVDDANDQVLELAGEGRDTVNARISYVLGNSLENLNLLDFSTPAHGSIEGTAAWIFGDPRAYPLDYRQGDAVDGFRGTCGLVAIANVVTQSGTSLGEGDVVFRAIANQWATLGDAVPAHVRGATTWSEQRNLLDSYGVANYLLHGFNAHAIANFIRSGRGVILAVDAGLLWKDPRWVGNGRVNHVVTLTGYAASSVDGALLGFFMTDSGRGLASDRNRYVTLAELNTAANVPGARCIYTAQAIKLWDENTNATGNHLNNVLSGNRGDNVLAGGLGYDVLRGGFGDDTYRFKFGDGYDTIIEDDAKPTPTLHCSTQCLP